MKSHQLAIYHQLRARFFPAWQCKRIATTPKEVTHIFWLRPGLKIILQLPDDITKAEASRLAAAVLTFPTS